LDYALDNELSIDACQNFVDSLGLKVLFPVFMGKFEGKSKKLCNLDSTGEEGIIFF